MNYSLNYQVDIDKVNVAEMVPNLRAAFDKLNELKRTIRSLLDGNVEEQERNDLHTIFADGYKYLGQLCVQFFR